MTSQVNGLSWDKDEERLCYDCGMTACSQADIGHGVHWYCFRCLADNYEEGETEIDNSLETCQKQLEIQSEMYN